MTFPPKSAGKKHKPVSKKRAALMAQFLKKNT